MRSNAVQTNSIAGGDVNNKGYKYSEASQFIEFCVELDSQDDRMDPANKGNANFIAEIDSRQWNPNPIFDSRAAVGRDLVSHRKTGQIPENAGWVKLYEHIIKRINMDFANKKIAKPYAELNERELIENPNYNGFGPYQSAWVLYEGVGENKGAYTVAIRGTVMSNMPSAVEDILFHPVSAKKFISDEVSFGSFDGSAVHSGFAHATFSLLLDDKYGVLRAISTLVPANSRLFIVGHSQGAAMATLVHAFLHNAGSGSDAGSNVFALRDKNFSLKSYAFAQPKPGNFTFSADFASITQPFDNAIVINNDIDPVPQVPLTLQDISDLNGDLPEPSIGATMIRYAGGIGGQVRGLIGRLAEHSVIKSDAGFGYYFNYLGLGTLGDDRISSSWNFTAAGHVFLVYGTLGDKSDEFLQHHAFTYRNLIRSQLS
jgi:hypothetical protein